MLQSYLNWGSGRERECCLLVLNSVTSTLQWIRQPWAAWYAISSDANAASVTKPLRRPASGYQRTSVTPAHKSANSWSETWAQGVGTPGNVVLPFLDWTLNLIVLRSRFKELFKQENIKNITPESWPTYLIIMSTTKSEIRFEAQPPSPPEFAEYGDVIG